MNENLKDDLLQLLRSGDLDVEGLLPWSSNYTFLLRVCGPQGEVQAVYKPRRGERPLWDFRQGSLCLRERAAFLVSEILGWHLVPPTVLRDGPHGIGSLQYFVDHDPDIHYFTFEGDPLYRTQLQRIALFDSLVNNADRKSGHVLMETPKEAGFRELKASRLWAIDHGICFHADYKLRTVIWEFAGEAIPPALLTDLLQFKAILHKQSDTVSTQLRDLLSKQEISALQERLDRLIKRAAFPQPGPGRHYPWPPV